MAANGVMTRFIDSINPDDPEYIRDQQRPAAVAADIQEMQKRERVQQVLKATDFRSDLESLIIDALSLGANNPTSVAVLQHISEITGPVSNKNANQTRALNATPINDVRGGDGLQYSKCEKQLRCKLSTLFRLIDLHGWSDGLSGHITARVSQDTEHFLIDPHGMLYKEITASCLVKVDMQGNVVMPGSTPFGIDQTSYRIHAAIHAFRPDLKCIVHLNNGAPAAVSSMKCGLLPISHEAVVVGNVSYFEYNGFLENEAEEDKFAKTLGVKNKVMVLRNNGILVCGATIEEAFHICTKLNHACDTQVRAVAVGVENLTTLSEDVRDKIQELAGSHSTVGQESSGNDRRWKTGELEFEAWTRVLDNAGYRTGHHYKEPMVKSHVPGQARNRDIEYPPASSSLLLELDEDARMQLLRDLVEKKKEAERTRWIYSPNAYQKVEMSESGTPDPQKVVRWVKDKDASPIGTPLKISSSLQFAPPGTDAKEMKSKQAEMKARRMQGEMSSGPQSKRVNWDEADQFAEAMQRGDRLVTVSAVSKGIIERDQQLNVGSYKQTYARNPFTSVTDEEINAYKREVVDGSHGRPASAQDDERHVQRARQDFVQADDDSDQLEQPNIFRRFASARSKGEKAGRQGGSMPPDLRSKSARYGRRSKDEDNMDENSKAETLAASSGKKKKKGFFSFGSSSNKKDKKSKAPGKQSSSDEISSPTKSP